MIEKQRIKISCHYAYVQQDSTSFSIDINPENIANEEFLLELAREEVNGLEAEIIDVELTDCEILSEPVICFKESQEELEGLGQQRLPGTSYNET